MSTLAMSLMSVFLTCVSVRWYFMAETQAPPHWLRSVARFMKLVSCVGIKKKTPCGAVLVLKVQKESCSSKDRGGLQNVNYESSSDAETKEEAAVCELTYQELSGVFDNFFLRIYIIATTLLTLGCFTRLMTGDK